MITSQEIWSQVAEAIQTEHTLSLSYVKKAGVIVGHEVVPIDILVKMRGDGRRAEYLFGHRLDFSRWQKGERTERQFLLDRILSLKITRHAFHPSDYLDLTRTEPRWTIPRKWMKAA